MNRVDGKIALVTGAAGGIGSATSRLLASAGATVVLTDSRSDEGHQIARDIVAAGGTARFIAHDVTEEADWARVVADICSQHERLDILVNNAGIYRFGRVEDSDEATLNALLSVNLKGVVYGTKHAFLAMKHRPACAESAAIINLSSIAGLVGSPISSIYSLTKGGVRLYTKACALEAAQLGYNIRVNSVHPGIVDTDMAREVGKAMRSRGLAETQIQMTMASSHPLGRMAQADDIAKGILFLSSNDSAFMTGSELVIDGGWTAR